MRHRKSKSSLNRFTSWRRATLNSMSRNLLTYQSIKTTMTKAKAARPLIEKLITMAKKNDLASRRRAFAILQDHKLVQLLFSDIATRFDNQKGGYCRILPCGFRRGDGAELVILELTKKSKIEKKKPLKKEETQEKIPKEQPAKAPEEPAEATPPPMEKKKFLGGLRKIFDKEKGHRGR